MDDMALNIRMSRFVSCPRCKGLIHKDCPPQWIDSDDPKIKSQGPICPYCKVEFTLVIKE